jgi:hypothetical protein
LQCTTNSEWPKFSSCGGFIPRSSDITEFPTKTGKTIAVQRNELIRFGPSLNRQVYEIQEICVFKLLGILGFSHCMRLTAQFNNSDVDVDAMKHDGCSVKISQQIPLDPTANSIVPASDLFNGRPPLQRQWHPTMIHHCQSLSSAAAVWPLLHASIIPRRM